MRSRLLSHIQGSMKGNLSCRSRSLASDVLETAGCFEISFISGNSILFDCPSILILADLIFPIDISSVKREHDFLDRDAIEALCRYVGERLLQKKDTFKWKGRVSASLFIVWLSFPNILRNPKHLLLYIHHK